MERAKTCTINEDMLQFHGGITTVCLFTPMPNSLFETCLQRIMVVTLIILDWIFVLMNTTRFPLKRVSERCNRELKQRRRRRRERRQRNKRMPRSAQYANGSKNLLRLNMQRRRTVPKWKCEKLAVPRPSSVDGVELGHFTLLFCRGRQRNVQKRTCTAIVLLIEPFV